MSSLETKNGNVDPVLSASVVRKFPLIEIDSDYSKHEAEFKHFTKAVANFLESNHIDPETVLFSGYDRDGDKTIHSEFESEQKTGETWGYFFGDFASLNNPANFIEVHKELGTDNDFENDQELQDDHWVVNPFNFALEGGVLGVFSKDALAEAAKKHTEEGLVNEDAPFGTYTCEITPGEAEAAKIADLYVTGEARAKRLARPIMQNGLSPMAPNRIHPSDK